MQPPAAVLEDFGASAQPVLLSGGQGITWRAGDIVLKPCRDIAETVLCAQVYSDLGQSVQPGFRLPQPLKTRRDQWISRGWSAWAFVPGRPQQGRWDDKIRATLALHQALAQLPHQPIEPRADDPWAQADRAAWGQVAQPLRPGLQPIVEALRAVLRPIAATDQLIHADICGNFLFAEGGDPYIIDFTPSWRPAGFALGLLLVDALVWEGADASVLDCLDSEPDFFQLLARAHLRRLIELETVHQRDDLVEEHWPTARLICQWARGD
ncbi:MAG: TIGR02569 family protein [Candidatus Latescibacteria bacterium]|nr:TIGR02569 family protein [Candidatus Latescibacterota bacterium]